MVLINIIAWSVHKDYGCKDQLVYSHALNIIIVQSTKTKTIEWNVISAQYNVLHAQVHPLINAFHAMEIDKYPNLILLHFYTIKDALALVLNYTSKILLHLLVINANTHAKNAIQLYAIHALMMLICLIICAMQTVLKEQGLYRLATVKFVILIVKIALLNKAISIAWLARTIN